MAAGSPLLGTGGDHAPPLDQVSELSVVVSELRRNGSNHVPVLDDPAVLDAEKIEEGGRRAAEGALRSGKDEVALSHRQGCVGIDDLDPLLGHRCLRPAEAVEIVEICGLCGMYSAPAEVVTAIAGSQSLNIIS